MSEKEKASPINWYGGKGGGQKKGIRNDIYSYINESKAKRFIDVFGGSGLISLNVNKDIVVYNDIDQNLVNFFKVLQEDTLCDDFIKKITLSPYSEYIYEEAKEKFAKEEDKVKKSVLFYILTMQSRNATGAMRKETWSISKSLSRRGMAQKVSAYLRNVDENLPDVIEIIRTWQITNQDYMECIRKWDSSESVFYLDPPYIQSERVSKNVYSNELSTERHRELINMLISIKGCAIISGYDNAYYDRLCDAGWGKKTYEGKTTTSPKAKKSNRVEVIWYKN